MTPEQRRAIILGCELDRLRTARASLASFDTPQLDQDISNLRLLLGDALEATAPGLTTILRRVPPQVGSREYWQEMHAGLFGPPDPKGRHRR